MKHYLCIFITLLFTQIIHHANPCDSSTSPQVTLNKSILSFPADIHIQTPLPQDTELLEKIRPLFIEKKGEQDLEDRIRQKVIREYNGQEIFLKTNDKFRISALYCKQQNALFNIIYVIGYFFNYTPTKEWCAPLIPIFPECNFLAFDWRGFGKSSGQHGYTVKNSFGSNATHDIQAAIDFMRKENNKPIILIGFCYGAAMAMHTIIQAKKNGLNKPDALVCDCIFSEFSNQFDRAFGSLQSFLPKTLYTLGYAHYFAHSLVNGDLFALNPIEMIQQIDIPCYFEHYTYDQLSSIDEAIQVYQRAQVPKMFMRSDVGRHVRIHGLVPYQYRCALLKFAERCGFIPPHHPF